MLFKKVVIQEIESRGLKMPAISSMLKVVKFSKNVVC